MKEAKEVKKKLKERNGITLIALVITIIVLLILAGISIMMLTGENSILNQATNAKESTIKGSEQEAISIAYSGVLTTNLGDVEEGEEFQTALQNELTKNGQNATVSDNGKTITYDNGHVYKLDIAKGTVTKKEQQDRSKINVGDFVEYAPPTRDAYSTYITKAYTDAKSNSPITQQYKIWRVLNKNDDGTLDLIPAFKDTGVVYTKIAFVFAKGYNNSVYILDDICKTLYEKTNSDADKSITARSLDYEDITRLLVQNDNTKGKNRIESNRTTQTYTNNNANYPVLHPLLKNESDPYYTSENFETEATSKTSTKDDPAVLEVENTYFSGAVNPIDFMDYDATTQKSKKHEVIFETPSNCYWLASRTVHCYSDQAFFGIRRVSGTNLYSYFVFRSDGGGVGDEYRVCPIVSLGSSVQVTPKDGTNEDGKRHVVQIPR